MVIVSGLTFIVYAVLVWWLLVCFAMLFEGFVDCLFGCGLALADFA